MSDVEKDVSRLGHHALRTARVDGLRRRMAEYVETHGEGLDVRELRKGVSTETQLSDLVDEGRNERV